MNQSAIILPSQKLEAARKQAMEKYSDYSLEQRLDLIAKCYGARSATIERRVHRKDEWYAGHMRKKGTTTLNALLDTDHFPFKVTFEDVPTKESRKESVQLHATDRWLEYSNPDFLSVVDKECQILLKKMEQMDNKRAARLDMLPYRLLYFDIQTNNMIIEVDSKLRMVHLKFDQTYQGKLLDEIVVRSQDKDDVEKFPDGARQDDRCFLLGDKTYFADWHEQDMDQFLAEYYQEKFGEKFEF